MRAGSPWKATRSRARRIQRQSASIVLEDLERELVGRVDVGRIARERRPAERALALAEERPDVFGHEAGDIERVRDAAVLRLGADVVAVVEHDRRRCAGSASMARTCSAMAAIERARVLGRSASAAAPRLRRASGRSGRSRSAHRAPTSGRSRTSGVEAAARERRAGRRRRCLRAPAIGRRPPPASARCARAPRRGRRRARRRSASPAGVRCGRGRPRRRARCRRSW